MDMIEIQEHSDRGLVEVFSASDVPEARIDLVRAHWNQQMERTRRRLRQLTTERRIDPAATEDAGSLPARAGR